MAFQKLDSNGDGFLDLEEIISQLPAEDAENVTTRRERLLEVRNLHLRTSSIFRVDFSSFQNDGRKVKYLLLRCVPQNVPHILEGQPVPNGGTQPGALLDETNSQCFGV